jgi:hypothetical protein
MTLIAASLRGVAGGSVGVIRGLLLVDFSDSFPWPSAEPAASWIVERNGGDIRWRGTGRCIRHNWHLIAQAADGDANADWLAYGLEDSLQKVLSKGGSGVSCSCSEIARICSSLKPDKAMQSSKLIIKKVEQDRYDRYLLIGPIPATYHNGSGLSGHQLSKSRLVDRSTRLFPAFSVRTKRSSLLPQYSDS